MNQTEKDVFINQLNKLICDFSKKKEWYYNKHILYSWAITIANACTSFAIGISFIEELAFVCKIAALVLSSILIVLNGAYNFLNYKNAYTQRTQTLILLMSLRRRFAIHESNMTKEDLELYSEKLEAIMRDDMNLWHHNLPKDKN